MKKLASTFLSISLTLIQPINALEILPEIQHSGNPTQLFQQFSCPSGNFNIEEARSFLRKLKREVKEQHGIELDFGLITENALEIMIQSGQFSNSDIATAREFYSELIKTETKKVSNARSSKKKKKVNLSDKCKASQELVLPDKMAQGFMFILGGAVLCVLPFGITQGLGTGLIATGIAFVADSASSGDKPYYVNTETGQMAPGTPDSRSGIGVSSGF